MRRKYPIYLLLAITLFGLRGIVVAEDDSNPDPSQVTDWVRELDSDEFVMRNLATNRLIDAGEPSIDAITSKMPQSSLEFVTRGIYILRELAICGDVVTELAAHRALQQLAESGVSGAAQRATASLGQIQIIREKRARSKLKALGAKLETQPLQFGGYHVDKLLIDRNWRGTDRDLLELRWLRNVFAVRLVGPQVTDQWLENLSQVSSIGALAVFDAKITDGGLSHLESLPKLQYLYLGYCPITDGARTVLARFGQLERLALFGTEVSESVSNELATTLGEGVVDYRVGAFLGIRGGIRSNIEDLECVIDGVHPGGPAEEAELRAGDVITHYMGRPVKNFQVLTRMIAEHRTDDNAEIVINRNGRTVEKSIKLGRWDHTALPRPPF